MNDAVSSLTAIADARVKQLTSMGDAGSTAWAANFDEREEETTKERSAASLVSTPVRKALARARAAAPHIPLHELSPGSLRNVQEAGCSSSDEGGGELPDSQASVLSTCSLHPSSPVVASVSAAFNHLVKGGHGGGDE